MSPVAGHQRGGSLPTGTVGVMLSQFLWSLVSAAFAQAAVGADCTHSHLSMASASFSRTASFGDTHTDLHTGLSQSADRRETDITIQLAFFTSYMNFHLNVGSRRGAWRNLA